MASRKSRDLLEHRGVGQRRAGDVAEQADLAVLGREPPHHLHAAEHHQVVDRRHQPAGLGRREEAVRLDQRAVVAAQPRQRLVVAHLALRQRDHRLEIKVDAVRLDRARDRCAAIVSTSRRRRPVQRRVRGRHGLDEIVAPDRTPPRWRGLRRVDCAGACRRIGGRRVRRRQGARRRGVRHDAFQHLLVRGDAVRKLLHELAAVRRSRRRAARAAARALSLTVAISPSSAIEPSAEFGDLAADVGGAAREVGDVAADVGAVALAARDRVDHHERGHRGDRHHGAFHAGETECRIDDDADGRRRSAACRMR